MASDNWLEDVLSASGSTDPTDNGRGDNGVGREDRYDFAAPVDDIFRSSNG